MDDATSPPVEGARDTVRCTACVHYFITHDPVFPYGCRTLNFKSWRQPMLDVIEASGQPCLYFRAKRRDGGRSAPDGAA